MTFSPIRFPPNGLAADDAEGNHVQILEWFDDDRRLAAGMLFNRC